MGNFEEAVRLFGAAEVMREGAYLPIPLPERPIYDQFINTKWKKQSFTGYGQAVEQGQRIAILEAMKMENELRAPKAGTVTAVNVQAG